MTDIPLNENCAMLGHADVGMTELAGDHRHGNRLHGQDRGMGVSEHMERYDFSGWEHRGRPATAINASGDRCR